MKSNYIGGIARGLGVSALLLGVTVGSPVNAEEQSTAIADPGLWGLDRVDQKKLPLNGWFSFDSDGGLGVRAYVLDTGIRRTHAEFGGRVELGYDAVNRVNGGNDIRCVNGLPDFDTGLEVNVLSGSPGHGTHVAGIIGGRTSGVAKAVTLVPVRIFPCDWNEQVRSGGNIASLERGVDWVIKNHRKPAVVNLSLETDTWIAGELIRASSADKARVMRAVQRLLDAGIPTVVAAGNSGIDACTNAPSNVPDAITVAGLLASVKMDYRWDAGNGRHASNVGPCVDIWAPAYEIRSAWNGSDNDMQLSSGTSMAAPFVTGAVAAYLQHHPNASVAEVTLAIGFHSTWRNILNRGNTASYILNTFRVYDAGPNNSAPVARDDYAGAFDINAVVNSREGFVEVNVLYNDTDSDQLQIVDWTQPSAGAVSISEDNTYFHIHPSFGAGSYSFSYTIADGRGGFATAKVTYHVYGTVNDY